MGFIVSVYVNSCNRPLSYLHIAVIDITESETGIILFVITNYLIISLQSDYSRGSGATGVGGAKCLQ
jgi:hypothetical protein